MLELTLFSGNANQQLASKISNKLNIPLSKSFVQTFSDGEIQVEILENVRGKDVFIIQPTSNPTNDHLMELILMTDALRRSSAKRITAVIPYFGYARQDRRVRSARVPISAKVIADLLVTSGVNRIITVDLHSEQIQGFFNIPVDNIYASPVLIDDIKKQNIPNLTIVSPDVGGVVRARAFAKLLKDADLAIIDKRRQEANQSEVMHIIGDITDKNCVIIDDLIDTAGTICQAATSLKEKGANSVKAYCTHPVLSGQAFDRINNSDLDELVVTNSIKIQNIQKLSNKIRQLSISSLLSEIIKRVNQEQSVSCIFN